jgi:hypothetical protein
VDHRQVDPVVVELVAAAASAASVASASSAVAFAVVDRHCSSMSDPFAVTLRLLLSVATPPSAEPSTMPVSAQVVTLKPVRVLHHRSRM